MEHADEELKLLLPHLRPVFQDQNIFTSTSDTNVFKSLSIPQNVLFMNFTSESIFQAMNMFDMEKQRDYNFQDCKELLVVCEILRNQMIRDQNRFVVLYYPERMDVIALLLSCFLAYNGDVFSPIEVFSELKLKLFGEEESPFGASLKRYCGYFHALLHSPIPDPYATKLEYITMNHFDEQLFMQHEENEIESIEDEPFQIPTVRMIGTAPLFIIRGRSPIGGELEDFCVSPKAKPWFSKSNTGGTSRIERVGNRFDIQCRNLVGDFVIDCYFPFRYMGRLEYQRAFSYAMNNTLSFGEDTITVTKKVLDCAELISDSFVMHLHFKREILKDKDVLNQKILQPEELKYVSGLEELVYTSPASYLRDPRMRHYMRLQGLNPHPSKEIERLKLDLNKEFLEIYPEKYKKIMEKFQAEKAVRAVLKSRGSDRSILKYMDDLSHFKTNLDASLINYSSESESDEPFITEEIKSQTDEEVSNLNTTPSRILTTSSPIASPQYRELINSTSNQVQENEVSTFPPTEVLPQYTSKISPPSLYSGSIPPPPPFLPENIPPPPPLNGALPPLPSGNENVYPAKNNLKNFHWDVIPKNRAMISVWNSLSTYPVDRIELSTLFAKQKAQKRKNGEKNESSCPLSVLGGEKSRNIEIVSGQFKQFSDFTLEIPEYLNKLQEEHLNESQLIGLKQCIVSEKELELFHNVNRDNLSKGDWIAFKISSVPRIRDKIQTMLYLKTFTTKVEDLHNFLKTKLYAFKALMNSKMLLKIFEVLLSVGNILNEGNRRIGNATGFSFTSFSKAHFLKSSDGKLSLLQYVCILLKKDGYSLQQLNNELEDFFKGQKISPAVIEILENEINNVVDHFRMENECCKGELDVYREKVRLFMEYAVSQQEKLARYLDRYHKEYQVLLSYFGEQFKKEEEFFQPISEFASLFQQGWLEIEAKEDRQKRITSQGTLDELESDQAFNDK